MQVSKLHSILRPFLLRRIKSDVEASLPAKKELVLYADMTPMQHDINEQLRKRTLDVRARHFDVQCQMSVQGLLRSAPCS